MATKTINVDMLAKMFLAGAQNIEARKEYICLLYTSNIYVENTECPIPKMDYTRGHFKRGVK